MDKTKNSSIKIAEGFIGQKMHVLSPHEISNLQANILAQNLYLTAIGLYPKALAHERFRPKGSEEFILLYCTEGEGYINLEKEFHSLKANTYFILPKHIPHKYGSSFKNPWSIYWIHFTGAYSDFLYQRYKEEFLDPVIEIPYDPIRIKLLEDLMDLTEHDLTAYKMELLHMQLIQLISSFIYKSRNDTEDEKNSIHQSINFMKENVDQKISIKELANLTNYSVTHYSQLFREQTGYSPIQYFLRLKIQLSCQYLYFSKLTIKEICKKIGIEDPYYFSRLFKKQMLISPKEYRNKHKV